MDRNSADTHTGTRINAWPRDKPNTADPAFITRLGHAHLNAVESLPVFAAIVVAAHVTGKLALVDAIAPYVFYARVGQSLAHLSGGGQLNVFVRAGFFSAQLGALMYLVWALL